MNTPTCSSSSQTHHSSHSTRRAEAIHFLQLSSTHSFCMCPFPFLLHGTGRVHLACFPQYTNPSIPHQGSSQHLQQRHLDHPHSYQDHPVWKKEVTYPHFNFPLPTLPCSSVSVLLFPASLPSGHSCFCLYARRQYQVAHSIHFYSGFSAAHLPSGHPRCIRLHRALLSQRGGFVGFPGRHARGAHSDVWGLVQRCLQEVSRIFDAEQSYSCCPTHERPSLLVPQPVFGGLAM